MSSDTSTSVALSQFHTIQEYFAHTIRLPSQVVAFPRTSANLTSFTAQQIGQLSDRAICIYEQRGLLFHRHGKAPPVVGLRAQSSIAWVVSFVTLVRLGYTVLALSPKLSSETVHHLMLGAHCDCLIDGTSQPDLVIPARIIALVTEDELMVSSPPPKHDPSSWPIVSEQDVAYIIHSSGSTGVPKLIPRLHRELLQGLNTIPAKYRTLSYYVASGFYNGVGLMSLLLSFIQSRPTIYDNEQLPLTSDRYAQLLQEGKPDVAYFNPYSLALASSTSYGLKSLKRCHNVTVFGALCPDDLGDKLVQEGICLTNEFGLQEVSGLMNSVPGDQMWDYLIPNTFSQSHIELRPLLADEDNWTSSEAEPLYCELIVLPSHPFLQERWSNSDSPPGSYHTGDIFLKHRTLDRWKPVGRKDDQIKTFASDRQLTVNAVLYENRIKSGNEDILEEVVLFGYGRKRLGLLIYTKSDLIVAQAAVAEERVWGTIQQRINNGTFPVGLERNMLKVVEGRQIPRTPKGNVIRTKIYLESQNLINGAYSEAIGN
jgi:hypothetical protein